jgi:hypothetical protein
VAPISGILLDQPVLDYANGKQSLSSGDRGVRLYFKTLVLIAAGTAAWQLLVGAPWEDRIRPIPNYWAPVSAADQASIDRFNFWMLYVPQSVYLVVCFVACAGFLALLLYGRPKPALAFALLSVGSFAGLYFSMAWAYEIYD